MIVSILSNVKKKLSRYVRKNSDMYHLNKSVILQQLRGIYNLRFQHKKVQVTLEELVPSKPIASKIDVKLLPPLTKVDAPTIALLERLSLVNCANNEGVRILEDAIEFADQIQLVNTKGIEPLYTVLEDLPLETRADAITDGNIRADILSNASVTEEEYLVAPPGNIPLEPKDKKTGNGN